MSDDLLLFLLIWGAMAVSPILALIHDAATGSRPSCHPVACIGVPVLTLLALAPLFLMHTFGESMLGIPTGLSNWLGLIAGIVAFFPALALCDALGLIEPKPY